MNDSVQNLIDGIQLYVDSKIDDISNLTITNGIVNNVVSKNIYDIIINGKEYNNVQSLDTFIDYEKNDIVKILSYRNKNNLSELIIIGQFNNKATTKLIRFIEEHGGGGGGTTDYSLLTNKPKINNIELLGNKTARDLSLVGSTDIENIDIDFSGYFE